MFRRACGGKPISSLPPFCAGMLLAAAHAVGSRSAAAEEALTRAADALATLCKGSGNEQASSAPSMGPAALLALLPILALWLGSSAPEGADEAHRLPGGALPDFL